MSTQLVCCFLLAIAFSTICTKEVFVSKQRGSDDNDGSKENPFATLQRAYKKVSNGDTIFIEPAAYKEELTVTKSIKIKGYEGRPTIAGTLNFRENVEAEVSDLNMENTVRHLIMGQRIKSLKISNVNLGPKYLQQGNAIDFAFTEYLEVTNVKIIESDVGIRLGDTKFLFKNVEISNCKVGMYLSSRVKGTMEDSTITLTKGNNNIVGAGFYTAAEDITLKNVNLVKNDASTFRQVGGAFYCFSGGLNIYGGKIIGNKAKYGAAGECNDMCSFYTSGTEFKDNDDEYPSKCRGIPTKKK